MGQHQTSLVQLTSTSMVSHQHTVVADMWSPDTNNRVVFKSWLVLLCAM